MKSTYSDERIFEMRVTLPDEHAADHLQKPTDHPVGTGYRIVVLERSYSDGRRAVIVSERHRRLGMRASGKLFSTWGGGGVRMVSTTLAGLMLERDFTQSNGKPRTSHLFDRADAAARPEGRNELAQARWAAENRPLGHFIGRITREIARQLALARQVIGDDAPAFDDGAARALEERIASFLGEPPVFRDEFPLLDPGIDRHELGASVYMHWHRAESADAVAKSLFGKTRYRRPLGQAVIELHPNEVHYLSLYRGLVPIDWIVDAAKRAMPQDGQPWGQLTVRQLPASALAHIRAILRALPQEVLRRMLKEPLRASATGLADAAYALNNQYDGVRRVAELPELVRLTGQRQLRGTRHVEDLVRSLPRHPHGRPGSRRSKASKDALVKEKALVDEMLLVNTARQEQGLPPYAWSEWKRPEVHEPEQARMEETRRQARMVEDRRREEAAEARRLKRLAEEKDAVAWAAELTSKVQGAVLGTRVADARPLRVVVAETQEDLVQWTAQMRNCIGTAGYGKNLGIDVFFALVDEVTGDMVVNAHVIHSRGVDQFLCKHNEEPNKRLGEERTIELIGALRDVSDGLIRFQPGAMGLEWVPEQMLRGELAAAQ